MTGDDVSSQLDWSVVVDGRRYGRDEFGRVLAGFEGWEFRMQLGEGTDGVGGVECDVAGAGGRAS